MEERKVSHFSATIDIIGINPFVFVPATILEEIIKQYGKDKGKIPIKGSVNNVPYKQTLVKYSGEWRLYINTTMLKNSPKRIGELIHISIEIDNAERTIPMQPYLLEALNKNKEAKVTFDKLSPSRQQEIIKYFSFLKTKESINRNIIKMIDFLLGKGRFLGRENP